MRKDLLQEAQRVRLAAEMLFDRRQVEDCLDRLAAEVSATLSDRNPLFMCVMNGAVPVYAGLLSRLDFPLQTDYLHASRYRGELLGDELQWLVRPAQEIKGRSVVVVDDILDEGITLAGVERELQAMGAAEVYTLVLVQKQLPVAAAMQADFVGLLVPDRYVFGYGMDYKGYWRNLPGIYAVRD